MGCTRFTQLMVWLNVLIFVHSKLKPNPNQKLKIAIASHPVIGFTLRKYFLKLRLFIVN